MEIILKAEKISLVIRHLWRGLNKAHSDDVSPVVHDNYLDSKGATSVGGIFVVIKRSYIYIQTTGALKAI